MVEIQECPICGNHQFQKLAACIDYTVSHETFQIKQCTKCELGITSPRPATNQLGNYYQSEEYTSHSGKATGGIGKLYRIVRSYTLRWKKNTIERFYKSEKILDFGCGTGEFLHSMQKKGWSIEGIEPSELARTKASNLTHATISNSLENTPQTKVKVITAWHVLEHVPELSTTLTKLKSRLSKNGIIFIAVPNYQSDDGRRYKNFWAGYDVPRHLWHFSKKSMLQLLKQTGFELLEIVPMKLDAYYISLLSEKYSNGNRISLSVLIRALISGLKSNFSARKNTNHSSVIYIARSNEE